MGRPLHPERKRKAKFFLGLEVVRLAYILLGADCCCGWNDVNLLLLLESQDAFAACKVCGSADTKCIWPLQALHFCGLNGIRVVAADR